MKKRTSQKSAVVVGTLAILTWLSVAAQGPGTHPTREFMRTKLSYSQGILEGITLEKYDLVVTNATLLRNMNLTNAFFALKNPYYMENVTNFQTKVDGLIKAAKDRDLGASTDAYSFTLAACINCHKVFRLEQFQQNQGK